MTSYKKLISRLWELAELNYPADGKNALPHIRRVWSSASKFAELRNQPLTVVEAAAILLHDLDKDGAGDSDHGVWAAGKARTLLQGLLTPEEIDAACEAIAAHNVDTPSPSHEASLLRATDASIPDVGWYARKSVATMMKRGWSRNEALQNALNNIKAGRVWLAQLENVPEEWYLLWGKEVEAAKKAAISLTTIEQVEELIKQYNDSHPGESLYV
jgi:hypothetical protein